jgi:hypothetical protein
MKSDESATLHPDFEEYVNRFKSQYRPSSVAENFLIEQMAHAQWRMDRFAQLEASLLLEHPPGAREFARLRKHVGAARKSFQQALKTLLSLRKTRGGKPARRPGTSLLEALPPVDPIDFAPTA